MTAEKRFGSTVLRFDRVSSTNDVARDFAASGASEGLCVIAEEQTAGRGRQGRTWSSPAGEGLYMSVVLRPAIKPSESGIITLAPAIAVAETLRLDYEIDAEIKWPNDLMVGGRKICGILIESAVQDDRLDYIVLGIGVNTGQRGFPEEVASTATSVWLEAGRAISPEEFAEALLPRVEHWYVASLSDSAGIISRWEELSPSSRSCHVRVDTPDDQIEGITRGLTPSGALIVELVSGERREVVAGDVRVRSLTA
jgi:BirA family transcriptional regulator, biotin operon repressor / biotin---[acetyl-CoA-carboxylase] ligase